MQQARCPTCDRQFDSEQATAMPFCSERCRLIDLGRWLDEENSIPVDRVPDEFEEEDPASESQSD